MKIPANGIDNLLPGQAVGAGKNERAATADGKAAATGAVAGTPGKTDAFSSKIQTLRDRVAAGEVVDQAKVDRVQKAIADGTFKVNAEAVADKMLQGAADLFGNRQ